MARTRAVAIRRRRTYRARSYRRESSERGISLAVVGGFVPTIIDSWNLGKQRETAPGGVWGGFAHQALLDLTGFNTDDNRFYPGKLFSGWGPVLAGYAIHQIANRIGLNRMIRKMLPLPISI